MRFAREPAPSSCSVGEAQFRRILLRAAIHHIPTRYVREPSNNMQEAASSLIQKRVDANHQAHNSFIIRTLDQKIVEL